MFDGFLLPQTDTELALAVFFLLLLLFRVPEQFELLVGFGLKTRYKVVIN